YEGLGGWVHSALFLPPCERMRGDLSSGAFQNWAAASRPGEPSTTVRGAGRLVRPDTTVGGELMRSIPRAHLRLLLSLVAFAGLALVARADDWPQWLGPQRDGVWR